MLNYVRFWITPLGGAIYGEAFYMADHTQRLSGIYSVRKLCQFCFGKEAKMWNYLFKHLRTCGPFWLKMKCNGLSRFICFTTIYNDSNVELCSMRNHSWICVSREVKV